MHYSWFYTFCIGLAMVAWGCSSEQAAKGSTLPKAYGRIDNILVVSDKYIWDSMAIGDTFRANFAALYPVLPQEEPIYDLRHVDGKEFSQVLQTNRSIIILADLQADDEASTLVKKSLGADLVKRAQTDTSYRMAIARDRWASGQVVIFWFAPNKTELLQTIRKHSKIAMAPIQENDDKALAAQTYKMGINDTASQLLKSKYSLHLDIPKEYFIAQSDSNGLWMRFEPTKVSSNVFVYILDSKTAITPENLNLVRDTLTRKYFSSQIDSSYMKIDDRFLPVFYQNVILGGLPALQARGIWYMVNDFMGGAFITYLIKDDANDRVILLDGFVYAPGQKKRPEMRRLEIILSTLQTQISQ